MLRRTFLAGAVLALISGATGATEPLALGELAKPGRVLMLRHARAPGTGDPPHFKLRDCSTQRNLDATGRSQAVTLGRQLAQSGLARVRVFSSQWCRCLDTARLLGLGTVTELPALNSFFGRPQDRDRNIGALRAFLAKLPVNGPPIILVTHQVTINAMTGAYAVSGGGVMLQLEDAAARVLGEIIAN